MPRWRGFFGGIRSRWKSRVCFEAVGWGLFRTRREKTPARRSGCAWRIRAETSGCGTESGAVHARQRRRSGLISAVALERRRRRSGRESLWHTACSSPGNARRTWRVLLWRHLGFPLRTAAAISLATVIATSSSVSAGRTGEELINLRLGTVLEVATVAGSLLGGITARLFAESTLQQTFAVVALAVAIAVLARMNQRNVILVRVPPIGRFGGRFYDPETRRIVAYRVRRIPLALIGSFVAGNVSSLLGIGGGIIKVPVLNLWCGVPLRVAAATSVFMIGVTATGGALIYYGRGDLPPLAAAPAVLGVHLGSWAGLYLGAGTPSRALKIFLGLVLIVVAGADARPERPMIAPRLGPDIRIDDRPCAAAGRHGELGVPRRRGGDAARRSDQLHRPTLCCGSDCGC